MNREIDKDTILALMARVETLHGKCMHDINDELESECVRALETGENSIFVINMLSRIIDMFEES